MYPKYYPDGWVNGIVCILGPIISIYCEKLIQAFVNRYFIGKVFAILLQAFIRSKMLKFPKIKNAYHLAALDIKHFYCVFSFSFFS